MKEFKQNKLKQMSEIRVQQPFSRTSDYQFDLLLGKKLPIDWTVVGTDAATAGNYGVFWIAPFAGVITRVVEAHQTAGTDAGSVTLNIEKLGSGVALDSGTVILSSAFSLKTTANTPQEGTLSTTLSDLQFSKNDRFALKDAGTLTSVNNVTISLEIKY